MTNQLRINEDYVNALCAWVRDHKGITMINVDDLADYYEEFEAYKSSLGGFNKVEESDFEG